MFKLSFLSKLAVILLVPSMITSREDRSYFTYSSILWTPYCEGMDVICDERPHIHMPFSANREEEIILSDDDFLRQNMHFFNGFKMSIGEGITDSISLQSEYTRLPSLNVAVIENRDSITSSIWSHTFNKLALSLMGHLPPVGIFHIYTEIGAIYTSVYQNFILSHAKPSIKIDWENEEEWSGYGPYFSLMATIPTRYFEVFVRLSRAPLFASSITEFTKRISLGDNEELITKSSPVSLRTTLGEVSLGATIFMDRISISTSLDSQVIPKLNTCYDLSGDDLLYGIYLLLGATLGATLNF